MISDAPHDSRRVKILVGNFTGKHFPKDNAERPDVHLLRARMIEDDLWRHPGECSGKAHFGADFVPLAAGAKVANLDHFVMTDKDAKLKKYSK